MRQPSSLPVKWSRVVLLGFMGAGKTTTGALLAGTVVRNLILLALFFLPGMSICCLAVTERASLRPEVDERVELLSIVFHLAGNTEYNLGALEPYTADIDSYFGPYKTHPAVLLAKKLAVENGVSFDAVMSMAISLSPPPTLSPLIPFSATIPDSRWGAQNASQFAREMQYFYRDTKAEVFFYNHRDLYREAEKRFDTVLQGFDRNWFSQFYGSSTASRFHLVLGLNNGGGNYGPRLVDPAGNQEFYAIIGAGSQDGSGIPKFGLKDLPMLIHEFNHSFVNPLVQRHWQEFTGIEGIYRAVQGQMNAQAYNSSEAMVDESLVRAGVILYFDSRNHSALDIGTMIHKEQGNGFIWMDDLCALLRQYEAQRDQYHSLESFMPQIAHLFAAYEPQILRKSAMLQKASAHVVSIEPFSNHSPDVDPSIQEMVIRFDKPLNPNEYSFNYGAGGKEHFPFKGRPVFLPGNQAVKLLVSLKPHWDYSFTLTSVGFSSADGYPLQWYTVSFRTR